MSSKRERYGALGKTEDTSSDASAGPYRSTKKEKKKKGCALLCEKLRKKIIADDCGGEIYSLLSIAWAIIVTSFLQFFMQSISIIMCGHLSTIELDSVALANTLVNVLGVTIIGGMSTAFDTFFSQTYGAGNKKGVGVYLQRALILAYLVFFCLACIHINIEPILVLLGQDKLKARMAGEYILFVLPGLFFDFNFQTLAKYLQNQGRVIPPMLCAAVGNIVNAASQYVCLFVFHFTYRSSAICQSASFGVMVLLELFYIWCSGVYKETWDGWRLRQALEGWGEFMRIALPGILLIAMEAWCFEVGVLISGLINTVQMAAQAVIFQLEAWTFMLHFGLSIAVSIRVGHNLGALQPLAASTAYRVALLLSLLMSTVVAILVFSLRYHLASIFTTDVAVIAVTSNILPIFVLFNYLVGIAHVTSGALRGCGRQLVAAVMVFVGYYIIGLPVGVPLALLTSLMVLGYWCGLTLATLFETIGFSFYMCFGIDWMTEAKKAQTIANSDTLDGTSDDDRKKLIRADSLERSLGSKESSLVYLDMDAPSKERKIPVVDKRVSSWLYWKRLLIVSIVLLILAGAICVRIFLPTFWRQTCIEINKETLALKVLLVPYCALVKGTVPPTIINS